MSRKTAAGRSWSDFVPPALAILLSLIPGLMLWEKLPAEIAVHFSISGVPDSYSSKSFVVFVMPLIALGLEAAAAAAAAGMVGRGIRSYQRTILWLVPCVWLSVSVLILAYALGFRPDIRLWAQLIAAAAIILVGNMAPKGVVWKRPGRWYEQLGTADRRKILRFTGYCRVLGGAAMCLCAVAGLSKVYFVLLALTSVLPTVFAVRCWLLTRRAV